MSKGIFVTATGTDVGKTYITALLIKTMRDAGVNCGYYKAAISGASSISSSDAGYVNKIAKIGQADETLVSYIYNTPVSPHLAAKLEGNPLCMEKIKKDYNAVCDNYDYVITEGSGGIVCPLRWDDTSHIMLEDIIQSLSLPTIVVADGGLGTINATVLTIKYLQQKQISVIGIIINHFTEDQMQMDNINMIEQLTGVKVICTVKENDVTLDITADNLQKLFKEKK